MKWPIGKKALRVLPPVAVAVGAALVDVGVLDARLYRSVLLVAQMLGLPGPSSFGL